MKSFGACLFAFCFLVQLAGFSREKAEDSPKPESHKLMDIEGWQVHVDERLLSGSGEEQGKLAIRLLSDKLFEIKMLMQPDRVKKLQAVHIWLEQTHGKLKTMQYHPDSGWLKSNGYPVELAKCVHIPEASDLTNPASLHQQPYCVLHELAHSYHDQVLGFDEPEIQAAWKDFVASGKYKSTLHIDGKNVKHYALTDHKEFFAEMTEAYFGMNDFYPFNSAELKRDEPKLYELLEKIWGPRQKK